MRWVELLVRSSAFDVVAFEFSDKKTGQSRWVVSVERRYKGGCTSTTLPKYGRRAAWIRDELPDGNSFNLL